MKIGPWDWAGPLVKWPLNNPKLSDSAITAAEVRWRLSQWRGEGERETEQREERERGRWQLSKRVRVEDRTMGARRTSIHSHPLLYVWTHVCICTYSPPISLNITFSLLPSILFNPHRDKQFGVDATCLQTGKWKVSHLNTYRLHKRISGSRAVSHRIYTNACNYIHKHINEAVSLSWKAPCRHMWSCHASFLLHCACVCVCMIQDWFISGYLKILNDYCRTKTLHGHLFVAWSLLATLSGIYVILHYTSFIFYSHILQTDIFRP